MTGVEESSGGSEPPIVVTAVSPLPVPGVVVVVVAVVPVELLAPASLPVPASSAGATGGTAVVAEPTAAGGSSAGAASGAGAGVAAGSAGGAGVGSAARRSGDGGLGRDRSGNRLTAVGDVGGLLLDQLGRSHRCGRCRLGGGDLVADLDRPRGDHRGGDDAGDRLGADARFPRR